MGGRSPVRGELRRDIGLPPARGFQPFWMPQNYLDLLLKLSRRYLNCAVYVDLGKMRLKSTAKVSDVNYP